MCGGVRPGAVRPGGVIVLFTDFGLSGPYIGQMKAVLHRDVPGVPVVDLFADAPAFAPRESAYLLAAYAMAFPADTIFLGVVDPGVGGPRAALAVEADGRWFVGPDNGLLSVAAKRAERAAIYHVDWRPETLSASFHGRDLFAPVAARLARGAGLPECRAVALSDCHGADWPPDLDAVAYIDRFGNAITGRRADTLPRDAQLRTAGRDLARAQTFSDAAEGAAFWYENANGLAEIAVNRGRADVTLGLSVGTVVSVVQDGKQS